jgi:hypothetical protein
MAWIVHVPAGDDVHLVARHDRAGVVRTTLRLPP